MVSFVDLLTALDKIRNMAQDGTLMPSKRLKEIVEECERQLQSAGWNFEENAYRPSEKLESYVQE